ncbi:MAG: transglycosylase SLT domain-containing protein, partial [Rhodospirillales bacterium]|nr:transglycosylase SLT domain-containing protein [Rhodospirillales bacterium]
DQRADPGLVLDEARALRRAGRNDDAATFWTASGAAAERAAPAAHLAAFWAERGQLARDLLAAGEPDRAYAVADDSKQTGGEQVADAQFLAGFIALRRLHDPVRAAAHFQKLADFSPSAITQGRALYWLGRAAEASGDAKAAKTYYQKSAAWPETFYGQLAALRLGESAAALAGRIAAVTDPQARPTRALALAGRELARAAAYLVAWGEPRRAQAFLLRLDDVLPDREDRVLDGRLALGFGLPQISVAIARRAGSTGLILLQTGWPIAADPPAGVAKALSLGIIRQESSFDTTTVSPSGARGLMQLMPGTAASVAHQLAIPVSVSALVVDPDVNLRLGTAYLAQMLDRFQGCVPLAVAAYNAGPNRVDQWLAAIGDPRQPGGPDMIDWIEQIPFGETRNYVQRVIENQVVYGALLHQVEAHPLAPWLH